MILSSQASCSHPLHFPEPLQHHSNRNLSHSTKFRIPKLRFSYGSFRFSRTRNMVPCKSRINSKKTTTDDVATPSAQTSDEKETMSSTNSAASPASSFLSVLCPLLRFFGGGDPSQDRNDFVEVATSSLSSLARLPWGSRTTGKGHSLDSTTNALPYLQLYEFEACPFCRRVRESLTELDLSVEVYPCPKGSLRHRDMVRKIGGKEQFPFLVDLNTGISMYESGDIVKYLFKEYGQGRNTTFGLLESTLFTGWVPTLLRAGRGMTMWDRAGVEPPAKLELFSYENNPYARIVREALCELELPYTLYNVGEGSSKSELLSKLSGSKEVPYLIDTNTGFQASNYKNILSYLYQQYSSNY